MSYQDRIAEVNRRGIYTRLLKGSAILGTLWMAGLRCVRVWARECSCKNRSGFCDAKLHWARLFAEWDPESHRVNGGSTGSKWQIIEDMTVRMFQVTALTATVGLPGGHKIRVGADGTSWKTITDLGKLQGDPKDLAEAVRAVKLFQKTFTWKP